MTTATAWIDHGPAYVDADDFDMRRPKRKRVRLVRVKRRSRLVTR
jgi:hypothetical protein